MRSVLRSRACKQVRTIPSQARQCPMTGRGTEGMVGSEKEASDIALWMLRHLYSYGRCYHSQLLRRWCWSIVRGEQRECELCVTSTRDRGGSSLSSILGQSISNRSGLQHYCKFLHFPSSCPCPGVIHPIRLIRRVTCSICTPPHSSAREPPLYARSTLYSAKDLPIGPRRPHRDIYVLAPRPTKRSAFHRVAGFAPTHRQSVARQRHDATARHSAPQHVPPRTTTSRPPSSQPATVRRPRYGLTLTMPRGFTSDSRVSR